MYTKDEMKIRWYKLLKVFLRKKLALEKQGKCIAFQNQLLWIELMDM